MQGDLRLAQEGAQHPMTLTVLQTYFSSAGNINAGEQILPTDADNPQNYLAKLGIQITHIKKQTWPGSQRNHKPSQILSGDPPINQTWFNGLHADLPEEIPLQMNM